MSKTTLQGKAWSAFSDVELAPTTKALYARWLQIFLEYCQVDCPDDLLKLGTVQEIEDRVIEWLISLKTSNSTSTMRAALACVMLFYSANRVRIDQKFISRRIPKKPALPHRAPTKEELVKIAEAANPRGKALVGVFLFGVRLGVVPPLKIRHTRFCKTEELEHHDCNCKDRSQPLLFRGYLLKVYEGEPEEYFTFISEEGSRWLDAYQNTRENCGEVLTANSSLIREEFDIEKPKSAKSCGLSGLQSFMSRLAITAGVKPIVKKIAAHQGRIRQEWKNVHGYRQYFSTMATNAGVNFSFKELLMGHHLNLEKSYYDSNNQRSIHFALAEYLKMQDAVTLFSSSRLERENEALRNQNAIEIQDLYERNEKLTRMVLAMRQQAANNYNNE
jgi:hypothetical protein